MPSVINTRSSSRKIDGGMTKQTRCRPLAAAMRISRFEELNISKSFAYSPEVIDTVLPPRGESVLEALARPLSDRLHLGRQSRGRGIPSSLKLQRVVERIPVRRAVNNHVR